MKQKLNQPVQYLCTLSYVDTIIGLILFIWFCIFEILLDNRNYHLWLLLIP